MKYLYINISLLMGCLLMFCRTGTGLLYGIPSGEPLKEGIFKESIHSVLMHRKGWKLSYPFMELNGDTKLEISFDDLTSRVNNYSYRIIHYDHAWNPTPVPENEYIEGLLENQILDYSFSFNTSVNYIHYTLSLPNEDINLKLSGNYALVVYEDFDRDKLVLVKKFVITEKTVNVQASLKRPALSVYRNSGQEIDFNVIYGNYPLHDPFSEINISILQNGRWDNAITHLKPLFIQGGSLEYNHDSDNVFPGGNEFRWFDIKSMRYQSPYIKEIEYRDNMYHVSLFPDENRDGKLYFYEEDLNGKYYVEVQEQTSHDTDADYVNVYFRLPLDAPLIQGKLYVLGGLAGWTFDTRNELSYNFDTKAYETVLLLKQGYYNYQYAVVGEGQQTGDTSFTEGNYYETENDYIIFVYHRPVNSRYDRVIGYQIINSLYGNK